MTPIKAQVHDAFCMIQLCFAFDKRILDGAEGETYTQKAALLKRSVLYSLVLPPVSAASGMLKRK